MPSSAPAFSMDRTYYDMTSFVGRTKYYFASINPLMLLENKDTLAHHKSVIDQAKKGTLPKGKYTDAQMWDSRAKVEACVHSSTGDVIPPAFRMAAFVPVNFLIVPAMMLPSTVTSVPRTIAIHWINQSFNALVNYSNRGSDAQPVEEILKAYGAAVTVSLAGALTATAALRKFGGGGGMGATIIRSTLPMLSVAASGAANVGLMRKNEWMGPGVRVYDEDGKERGQSTAAGLISWKECSVARVLWNVPSMTFAPILAGPMMAAVPALGRYPAMVELMLIYAGLVLGVPPALAYYPPTEVVAVERLEKQFWNITREDGTPVTQLSFAKGL